jgi:hypothetical protein
MRPRARGCGNAPSGPAHPGGWFGLAATVSLVLQDGRVVTTHIGHCRGSQARPMSGADLSEKFLGQTAIGYRADRSEALLAEV